MLLAVDIGNTRIKASVYEADTMISSHSFTRDSMTDGLQSIIRSHKISDIVTSSVAENFACDALTSDINLHNANREWKFPFHNLYETPETLGIDRMILASGAVLSFPNQHRLVIDAGTCITYDFIDSENNYHGGAISPGIMMRYRGLHDYTANLPMLEVDNVKDFTGRSTMSCMHSGVICGTIAEIEGFIDLYRERWGNFIIILTGGDSDFLAARLKSTIFARSNFLLDSLNGIFQYNHE